VFCVQELSDASESVGGERVSQGGARGRAVEQVRGGLIEREKREKFSEKREKREKRENFDAKTCCDQSVTSRF
jgi:hypothetical protein